MNKKNKRRKKLMDSPLQKKILFLVFFSAIIPVLIVGTCLYYLIFNMIAEQLGIPEAIAYNLIPVAQKINIIILIALPITLLIIWFIALELSHRIAGPLKRIGKELDEKISGNKTDEPIRIREKDAFKLFVDKINELLKKYNS